MPNKKDDQGNDIVNDTVVDEMAQQAAPAIVESSEPKASDSAKGKDESGDKAFSVEERLDKVEAYLRRAFNDFGR